MMDAILFRKKYLGEVTLKNGEHVKFLFPVSEDVFNQTKEEADSVYKRIWKDKKSVYVYAWALIDNLNSTQFHVVYTNIKKYGDNYWKNLWEYYIKNS